MDMKSSQKLLNAQMDEAEHLVLCGSVSAPPSNLTFFSLVWTTRKWMYISVRVLGSSSVSLLFNTSSRTVAVIQQKTGM
ncbi:hypothetical protein PAMP_014632 [Pampus punctatissimus]